MPNPPTRAFKHTLSERTDQVNLEPEYACCDKAEGNHLRLPFAGAKHMNEIEHERHQRVQ